MTSEVMSEGQRKVSCFPFVLLLCDLIEKIFAEELAAILV